MGNNTKNVIDINGKRYDAVTGALLGDSEVTAPVVRTAAVAPPKSRPGQVVDGYRKAGQSSTSVAVKTVQAAPKAPATLTVEPKIATTPVPAKPAQTKARPAHAPAPHIAAHRPQQAVTLMRTAVKKPDLKATKLKAHAPADVAAVPLHAVKPKLSQSKVDPKREKHAKRVIQSPAVSRFGKASTVHAIAAPQHPHLSAAASKPASAPASMPAQHGAAVPNIPVRQVSHVTKQPDIFEQALARATSHEQKHVKAKKHKKHGPYMALASASMAVLLFLGVFAYFNAPSLNLRLASSRAGFEARMPNYSPAGFTIGNLSYSPGNVVLNYTAGENDPRSFDITQRVSSWDSEGLLSNFVSSAASAYQTYEKAGRTVYFYGNNSATWVDSGVWYTIDASNSLTKNQILDLAGSL